MTPVPSKWLTTLKFMLKPGRVVCSNERPPHQRRALFDPSWRPSRNYDIFQTGRLVTTPCLVRGHGEMSFLPLMGDFVHILSCTFEAVNCIKKAYLEYVLERSQTLRLSPHAHTHSTQNTSTKSITAVTDSLTNVLVISATKKKKNRCFITQDHWGRPFLDLAGLRISTPAQSRFSVNSNGLPHAPISEQQTAWVVVSRHSIMMHRAKLIHKLEEKKQGVERA